MGQGGSGCAPANALIICFRPRHQDMPEVLLGINYANAPAVTAYGRPTCCTMRFGSTAKVLAECKLKYCRISECAVQPCLPHLCKDGHCSGEVATAAVTTNCQAPRVHRKLRSIERCMLGGGIAILQPHREFVLGSPPAGTEHAGME